MQPSSTAPRSETGNTYRCRVPMRAKRPAWRSIHPALFGSAYRKSMPPRASRSEGQSGEEHAILRCHHQVDHETGHHLALRGPEAAREAPLVHDNASALVATEPAHGSAAHGGRVGAIEVVRKARHAMGDEEILDLCSVVERIGDRDRGDHAPSFRSGDHRVARPAWPLECARMNVAIAATERNCSMSRFSISTRTPNRSSRRTSSSTMPTESRRPVSSKSVSGDGTWTLRSRANSAVSSACTASTFMT